MRLICGDEHPSRPSVPVEHRAGSCYACTEAPRGLLYHRYTIDEEGTITDAKIVPPTSQNQPSIEDDLRAFLPGWIEMEDEALRWRCEQTIRNYDPCISCSCHFLRLEVERG